MKLICLFLDNYNEIDFFILSFLTIIVNSNDSKKWPKNVFITVLSDNILACSFKWVPMVPSLSWCTSTIPNTINPTKNEHSKNISKP